jgi:hypothetical protein
MLYEVRTYTLRPGTVAEFEERFAKRLPLREKHSKLGAFWHTEFGPLNQERSLWTGSSRCPRYREPVGAPLVHRLNPNGHQHRQFFR